MFGLIFWALLIALVIWLLYRDFKKRSERHLDSNGYYRDGYGELVHRRVAYKYVYDYPHKHKKRFGEYEIHHIDGNKTNNHPNNFHKC